MIAVFGPFQEQVVFIGHALFALVAGEVEEAEVDGFMGVGAGGTTSEPVEGAVSMPAVSPSYKTTLKPRASVQNSSNTEISKERLVTASQVPGGSWGMRSSMPAKKLTTLPCCTMTPFGLPVEPEV
ncbi:MAG: hypothetical protein M5U34_23455 [Chloroflexi bacterium]|nr:hypothetical protein [Chloroflexota bacterium]